MSPWDLASVGLKLLNLLSVAMVIGGGFGYFMIARLEARIKKSVLKYMLLGASLGAISTVLFFLVQVGGINQSGLVGMFDAQLIGIFAQTGLGLSCFLRLLGYIGTIIIIPNLVAFQAITPTPKKSSMYLAIVGYFIASMLFSSSFPLTGHIEELGAIAHLALTLHVITAFLWIGALYPLLLSFRTKELAMLSSIMERFGKFAVYLVGLLVLSGAFIAIEVLETPNTLLRTPYGLNLLLKLIGVAALLLLAVSNKFLLVPNLDRRISIGYLQNSISMEMLVAGLVIAITSYFTTVVGITHA